MTTHRRACALAATLALCTIALCTPGITSAAQAQQPSRAQQPGGVALSPDGSLVAYTLRTRQGSTLHLLPVSGSAPEQTLAPPSKSPCSTTSPVWSPDGSTLAMLSTCDSSADTGPDHAEQQQILLWTRATGTFRQLTHLKGELQELAWSPDGKSIAFLFVENATRSAGALDAMKPWAGVIGEDGVEIQRVYGVDVVKGQGSYLTPEKLHVYEFAWAPSGKTITFIAANPPGENTWWIAKLYDEELNVTVREDGVTSILREAGSAHVVFDPNTTKTSLHGLQIAVPRYSPDGKQIAFIGGLMSDQGSTGGDIWVVPITGGTPTDVTPGIDGTPCFEAWLSNTELGFVEDRRGHTLLADYDATAHTEIASTDLGEVTLSGGAIKDAVSLALASKGAYIAFVESSFAHAPELYTVGHDNQPVQLTHLNAGLQPAARTISIDYENEGYHVQGWLTFPVGYDPSKPDASKKWPLIVEVHGGPSASTGARFGSSMWAEHGYFEFQPNPRGSFGQGEKFVQANVKDFGYGDLRDILKGLDTIEARYPVDPHREGLTGWSYGGFMTMFAVTQTHRFRAAVAGAGISDWLSYYGENSIDQWMVPFFGATVYEDPAVYARSSAINYIKNVTTPTLIIVGDRDGECPAPQSFEMWHALRALGVPTQLVVYPNEGHGFRNPEHLRDRAEREVQWFAKYMPEEQGAAGVAGKGRE